MLILPITTPLLKANDDLVKILLEKSELQEHDILVISSKAIATIEGAAINLAMMKPTAKAKKIAKSCKQTPEFSQAILNETTRMNGEVLGVCPYAVLTLLKPDGIKEGNILVPNAGLDHSNVAEGFAIGWPHDPVASMQKICAALKKATGKSLAVIISDSCCRVGRLGVTAFALTCAGMEPISSRVGEKDLFGKPLRVTREAVADQLAVAANALMGNAAECRPAAIVRGYAYTPTQFCGWVPGIAPKDDLFSPLLHS